MKKARLIALMSGVGKSGKPWYRVILKGKTENGPVVQEHWLDESVGRSAVQAGLVDDCNVYIRCDLDDYLRPVIAEISAINTGEDDEVLM